MQHEAVMNAGPFAVFESGGNQHRVVCGETIRLARLPGSPGDAVTFDRVLMIADGDDVLIGEPYLEGGVITGKLIAQGRGRKIRVIKFKRRKNYLRHKGHRQAFSDVLITGVARPSEVAKAVAEPIAQAAPEAEPTAPPAPQAEAA